MSPATRARAEERREHHAVLNDLSRLASDLDAAAATYDGHVAGADARSATGLRRAASLLRLMGASVIRDTCNLATAQLWATSAAQLLSYHDESRRSNS